MLLARKKKAKKPKGPPSVIRRCLGPFGPEHNMRSFDPSHRICGECRKRMHRKPISEYTVKCEEYDGDVQSDL